ncbi:hypothetical protein MTO96_003009 [Rhipicephalus appendiculatus]
MLPSWRNWKTRSRNSPGCSMSTMSSRKKSEEVEALEKELASVKGGRVAFFEEVSSVKKPKRKPLISKTGNKARFFTLADLDTTIETDFDSDGENDPVHDPDWCLSSELGQASRKRKSQEEDKPKTIKRSTSATACKCRGTCRSGALRLLKETEELLLPLPVQGGVFSATALYLSVKEDTLAESLPKVQLSLRSKN